MGNGSVRGIAPGTTLTSAEVRALLGDRFNQARFEELSAKRLAPGDVPTVTVEQLKHEIAGSIRSHHYPPNHTGQDASRSCSDRSGKFAGEAGARPSKDGGSRSEPDPRIEECKVGQRDAGKLRDGIHSEHFPPNYRQRRAGVG